MQTPARMKAISLLAAGSILLLFVKVFHNIEPMQRADECAHWRHVQIAAPIRAVVANTEEEATVVHNPRVQYKCALISVAGILRPTHQIGIVTQLYVETG